MIELMSWQICERECIRKVEKDPEKVASLCETARKRLQLINNIPVTRDNLSFVVEGYYEVIKELLVAYLLMHGMRSRNHQCLISYFYLQNSDHEHEAYIMAHLLYYRNRLGYYGELIPEPFYEKNKGAIPQIISLLFELIDKNR